MNKKHATAREHMSDNNFQEATQLFEVNNDVDM